MSKISTENVMKNLELKRIVSSRGASLSVAMNIFVKELTKESDLDTLEELISAYNLVVRGYQTKKSLR